MRFGGREIGEIIAQNKVITYAYQKGRLIYEAILSCFGKGYWINDAPFLNDSEWKNN
jgi:hypothetical protein